MKKLKSILLNFITSPVTIGIVVTLLVIKTAIDFYEASEDQRKRGYVATLVKWHQWSVDYRMTARGWRSASDRVAVLAVDERAVEQEGRWPWPRQKIAKIITEAVRHGSRVIAFDMVFAENDENSAFIALNRLKDSTRNLGPEFLQLIQTELAVANSDPILGNTVKTHGDYLVLGAYFDQMPFNFESYQEDCLTLLYHQNVSYQNWDREAIKLISLDDSQEMPDSFSQLVNMHFQQLAQDVTTRFCEAHKQIDSAAQCPENLSQKDRAQLGLAIDQEELRYCARWLKPSSSSEASPSDELLPMLQENWGAIQDAESDFKGVAFEDAIETFKARHLRHPLEQSGRWWMNIPVIAQNTKHTGYFNAFQDPDGSIRRTRLLARSGNDILPSLALKAFMVDQGIKGALVTIAQDIKVDADGKPRKVIRELSLTNEEGEPVRSIPIGEQGDLMINYAGPRYMYAHISVADLLDTRKPNLNVTHHRLDPQTKKYLPQIEFSVEKSKFLKDKILVFGATATGIYDLRVTPFEENYPGVETHANVVDNLLSNSFFVHHPDEPVYMLVLLLGLGILFSFLLANLGAVSGILFTIISLASIYFADKFFFFQKGTIVAILFPMTLVATTYVVLTFYKYFTEERKKKELKGTFEKYVSPAIVNEVLADPSNIQLGGRKEKLTVFFSDIRGFTTISEKLDPKTLSDFLNAYLTPMTNLVFSNKGTLDKYMGDAIMAFFGAPIHFPDHAKHAARCALQNVVKLKELQAEFRAQGLPLIDIGIGLNTGDMSVGNMGSNTVRNYTVMGDSVNLGSRLEGINKQYGTRIIISEFTYEEIKNDFTAREIDWVRVKGKLKPVKIYELMSEGKPEAAVAEMLKFFEDGFKLYHSQKWDEAGNSFNEALKVIPTDPVAKLYLDRCLKYKENPPGPEWDGVFVMTSK